MSTINSTKTEEPCLAYPWDPCDNNEKQIKWISKDSYLDHMSNLKIEPEPFQNILTTIACTIPPVVTKGLIEEFCQRGVSMIVLNFNGQSFEENRKMVFEIRQEVFNYSLNKNDGAPYSLALALDLEEPGIITGTIYKKNLTDKMIKLKTNANVCITNDIKFRDKCTADRIYVNSDCILRLKENDRIYLDYGKIELAVERVDNDEVFCVIKRGEFLGSRRVVHVPGMPIGTTSFTARDKSNVRTGIHLKVDVIMVAGARDAEYFNSVKNFIHEKDGNNIDVYVKIDNSIGLENIDKILPNANGVFLNRPKLSMEIGHDRIFRAQKIVLSKCNIAGKPTLTQGGFLNSMEYNTVPTSAEVNDVISTVLDGTDCIYLDVTERSAHKAHCVQYALDLCRQAELAVWDKHTELSVKYRPDMNPSHAISIECVEVSSKCHAAAIVVITTSGLSASTIARYRPRCPVLAIVRHGRCARRISVWRNVLAVHYLDPTEKSWSKDVANRTRFALKFAHKKGILNQGDLVLLVSCAKRNAGFANAMRLFYVGAGDLRDTPDERNSFL